MSAIPRPHRDAQPGEIVLFYEGGDPTEYPVIATVHMVHSGGAVTLTFMRPGYPAALSKQGVHHMHATYWDNVPHTAKQATGAFLFHPVYGALFDKHLQMAAMREAAKAAREEAKKDLSDDEFNAITALEKWGDNISKITEETGISRARLMKLPKFMEELNALKQRKWEEKNEAEEEMTTTVKAE